MNCILHPDRKATHDAQGILVCSECFDEYQVERRAEMSNSIGTPPRPFLQKLVRARHSLKEDVIACVMLAFVVLTYVLAVALSQ